MLNKKINVKISLLIFFLMISVRASFAAQSIAEPPANNPHPPVSDADKRRVAFAEKAIEILLKPAPSKKESLPGFTISDETYSFQIDEKCLNTPSCLSANTELMSYINNIKTVFGQISQMKHVHIIPWSWDQYKNNQSTAMTKPVQALGGTNLRSKQPVLKVLKQRNDEFMLHAYAMFTVGGVWYNVDVFLSEDENGVLTFRRFFIVPMEQMNLMPEGAVC